MKKENEERRKKKEARRKMKEERRKKKEERREKKEERRKKKEERRKKKEERRKKKEERERRKKKEERRKKKEERRKKKEERRKKKEERRKKKDRVRQEEGDRGQEGTCKPPLSAFDPSKRHVRRRRSRTRGYLQATTVSVRTLQEARPKKEIADKRVLASHHCQRSIPPRGTSEEGVADKRVLASHHCTSRSVLRHFQSFPVTSRTSHIFMFTSNRRYSSRTCPSPGSAEGLTPAPPAKPLGETDSCCVS